MCRRSLVSRSRAEGQGTSRISGGFRRSPIRQEEVRVLSKFRHPNLVILMGFAKNGRGPSDRRIDGSTDRRIDVKLDLSRPQRLLVYEHLGGGDVFRRLQKCAVDNAPWSQERESRPAQREKERERELPYFHVHIGSNSITGTLHLA